MMPGWMYAWMNACLAVWHSLPYHSYFSVVLNAGLDQGQKKCNLRFEDCFFGWGCGECMVASRTEKCNLRFEVSVLWCGEYMLGSRTENAIFGSKIAFFGNGECMVLSSLYVSWYFWGKSECMVGSINKLRKSCMDDSRMDCVYFCAL